MYLMRGFMLLAFAGLQVSPAMAQQPTQESPALRGLVLSLQQIGVSSEQYVNEVKSQLAAKDARIAELEKLCGELCKKETK